ncbi:hypothetical protein RIF29_20163 [Crotalaria pallida]|uniref:Rhodanese domain-containing protein n=1 Tax=Crotalaria pallida TaxID=3830 RepID=A0AAN9I776_CROPI
MARSRHHLHPLRISHLPYLPHSHLSSPLSPSPSLPHQVIVILIRYKYRTILLLLITPSMSLCSVFFDSTISHYCLCRTPEEFDAGHAPDAVNIPYMFRAGSGMTKNPNFLEEVSSQFRKDDEIRKEYIIIIRKSCNDQIQYSLKRHQDIEGSPSYTEMQERCTLIFYTTGSQLAFSPDGANAAGSVFVETLLFQLLRQTFILAPAALHEAVTRVIPNSIFISICCERRSSEREELEEQIPAAPSPVTIAAPAVAAPAVAVPDVAVPAVASPAVAAPAVATPAVAAPAVSAPAVGHHCSSRYLDNTYLKNPLLFSFQDQCCCSEIQFSNAPTSLSFIH